jgi:hypothetical protein
MRTLTEIRDEIRSAFVANTTLSALYGLNAALPFAAQFSAVSLEAAFCDVAALVSYTMEALFAAHTTEVETIIREQQPHTLRWYRNKALEFRLGQALITDTDKYSDAGLTPTAIAASRIVSHAAAIETEDGTGVPILRIKTAKTIGTELGALVAAELAALTAYFAEVKDAGVKLVVASNDPDSYKATIDVYYNPLLLAQNGTLLSGGGAEPVRQTVARYLSNLPFNGEFTMMALTDALQNTQGVVVVQIQQSEARQGVLPYQNTGARFIPYAGYMKVYNTADLIINYIPYNPNI